MGKIGGLCGGLVLFALLFCLPPAAMAATPAVHTFDCKSCHIPTLSVSELGGSNVCLTCHDQTMSRPLVDNTLGTVNNAFAIIDASIFPISPKSPLSA